MTKATQTITAAVVAVVLYLTFYLGIIPTSSTIQNEILPVVPFWSLVAFGAYALATLGWGVYSFKDKEAEYKVLLKVCFFFFFCIIMSFLTARSFRKLIKLRLTSAPRALLLIKAITIDELPIC